MKIIVSKHDLKIEKQIINEKEINIAKCEFIFDEDITNDFVKDVYFTLNDETYKISNMQNNECDIPNEVLDKKGMVELGVVAYLIENGEYTKRYNPTSTFFPSERGSLKEQYENTKPITPSDKEQIEQELLNISTQMDNLDIDAEKEEHKTTITITKKDGTTKEVEVLDGEKGDKGDKGEPGAIKMIIVNELPQTGQEDTIYLVPLAIPESQENRYAEYVYINDTWELLGKIGIQVDLTDYYTKTQTNNLLDNKQDKITQTNKLDYSLIDNTPTIPSKTSDLTNDSDFTTKTYVDNIVGDINTALDTINGEVI